MKLHWFVFLTLIGNVPGGSARRSSRQTEVVVQDGATEEVVSSSGFQHDRFSTMRQGGPGC